MPDLDLELITDAVQAFLEADPATSGVTWEKGRWTPFLIQHWPAGGVSLAPGTDLERAYTKTWGGTVVVRIVFWDAYHEGIAAVDAAMQDLAGKVIGVLTQEANWTLNIASFPTKPYISSVRIEEVTSNPEWTPPYGEITILASYTIRKA